MPANSTPSKPTHTGRATFLWRQIAVVALLLLTLHARAALQFDVFTGLDNYVPEASWFPITCEIHNDGPPFQAVIEVTGGSMNQGGYARLVPVELPTGTRKIITIPVFCANSYNGEWNVRLLDSSGRVRDEKPPFRPRGIARRNSVLLGALSRNGSWVPNFQKVQQTHSEWQPVAARLTTATFPDNSIVLEGMDALYLNSESAAPLRVAQVAAIEAWIKSGGHLIVGVEQVGDVNSAAWLRALVPMDLTGSRQVQPGDVLEDWLRSRITESTGKAGNLRAHGGNNNNREKANSKITMETPFADVLGDTKFAEAELSVAKGSLRSGGEVVLSVGGEPVIVTRTLGNGRVTVLLFSPEREPVRSWKNLPTFWSRITGVPARWHVATENYYSSGMSTDGIFGAMIDSRQVRKLPVHWLLLLLLAYLAVIGPVDQIWLKKIGKPMLTWITFPCYVALFSGLIYLVGYKLRAGESEWNELHVVDVFQSGQRTDLRGHTFGSIYSPVNQNYIFESSARASAFRSEFSGNYDTSGGDTRGRVIQSENSFKADVHVPVWTSQLYVNDWLKAGDAPFFATVGKTAGGWTVKIQNKLSKPLTHVRLVVKGKMFELGEVPADGKQHEFTQASAKSSGTLAEFVNRQGGQFHTASNERRRAFGAMESGRIMDMPNASTAVSFLSTMNQGNNNYGQSFLSTPGFDLSSAADDNNAILTAWAAGHAATKPLNQFTPSRQTVNTLWRMTLPME